MSALLRVAIWAWVCCWGALATQAGTLSGTVRNATRGTAAANQEVVLFELQGGMQVIATSRTDSQGRFQFSHPTIGTTPMLVRVQHQSVNYHENIPPGRTTADIEIYDTTTDANAFRVTSRFLVFQPNGPTLLIGEEFLVENSTRPPRTFYRPDGTFEFVLPPGAELSQVSAWGPAGMPVVQGTLEKGSGRHAIAFPIRPGENGIRISYQLPYPEGQTTLRISSLYEASRVLLAAPNAMQLNGTGLQLAGNEQGYNLYAREGLTRGTTFEIRLQGTATLPPAGAEAAIAPAEQTPTGMVTRLPPRLDSLKWTLIVGFAALFALGAFYLLRKPSVHAVRVEAEVEGAVRQSLDEIKETLFRLELRRQAGTISEEEFDREYRRTQERLRDFLKG
jgi:hypothetical protein